MKPPRPVLLHILSNLDQIDAVIEKIHSACLGTPLEGRADVLRESTWEMRGAVETALNGSPSDGEDV
jgi:hypothetical protein